MYNRSTIFQQSLPKPSWPGSHYLESLQELPALHVCIHTHISTQTWINAHDWLLANLRPGWNVFEWKMLGVSTAACKMSSRLLYQQLADVHRGQLQKCITCYLFCLFQQSYCDCICLCVYVCLWVFSFTLRLCEPVGCHTDAHKYVFTYVTLQRRYEILTYSPLELMDSTNWWGHCSYIHTLPLTCTIGICNSSKPSHIL